MYRAFVVAMLWSMSVLAQAPQLLSYQGRLVKTDGTPENGNGQMRFGLFGAETGGSSLWEETQAVSLQQGYYSTYLGRSTAFPPTLFDDGTLWLEVAVQAPGDTQFRTMTPRQRVGSVAFALSCRSLKGGAVDATSLSVNGTPVIDSSGRLTASAGYTAGAGISIDGATRAISVNSSGCATGQVLQWNGSTWQCASVSGTGGISGVTGTAPISVMNGTTTPVISVSVGTTAGTVAAGNDSRFGTLQGVAVSSTAPAPGQVLTFNGSSWAAATAGGGSIPDGGIGTNHLAAGAVTFDKLNAGGCATNQVLRFNGTSWGCASVGGSAAATLVSNFEFEETGMTFNDSSGLGNNATFSSGLTAGAIGHTGTGANFSGGFAQVAMGNSIPDTTQVEVDAWIWPQASAAVSTGVVAAKTGAWSLRYRTGTGISDLDFTVTTRGTPATCTVATTAANILTTGWSHISGYYDGLSIAISVNGAVIARAPCAKGSLASNVGTTLTLGGTSAGERYLGFLDELRVRSFAQVPRMDQYVYTEWGVATCTNGATTLMGDGLGSKNNYQHSDSDPTCLPRSGPSGATVTHPTAVTGGNLLYSMQLAGDRTVVPGAPTGNPKIRCALCAAPRRTCFQATGISCPAGFVTQYSGHLYSNHYTGHGGSAPFCLNTSGLDVSLGTGTDHGGYVYPVFQYSTLATTASAQFVTCAVCCAP